MAVGELPGFIGGIIKKSARKNSEIKSDQPVSRMGHLDMSHLRMITSAVIFLTLVSMCCAEGLVSCF